MCRQHCTPLNCMKTTKETLGTYMKQNPSDTQTQFAMVPTTKKYIPPQPSHSKISHPSFNIENYNMLDILLNINAGRVCQS